MRRSGGEDPALHGTSRREHLRFPGIGTMEPREDPDPLKAVEILQGLFEVVMWFKVDMGKVNALVHPWLTWGIVLVHVG